MITFEQLKAVLLQGEIEILTDNTSLSDQEYHEAAQTLGEDFTKAKTLLDLVNIYGDWGFDTQEANECIINTMMQLATLD
jgi:hypothetical protein